jgi:hypothetical protein
MFRALFEFFNSNVLSVCYDIKTNSLYERENEIILDKYNYKKNDDIKTTINDKINYDSDKYSDNINILFKNYNDNHDKNVEKTNNKEKENYNINNSNNINTDMDTDTDTYDIISNEDINENTL